MTDTTNPPQAVIDPELPDLKDCTCMERTFFAIGVETGRQIHQLIQAEISNHLSSIETLRTLVQLIGTQTVNPADLCVKSIIKDEDVCC
jgi:hypothetical protein